jgi:hypothetical protein
MSSILANQVLLPMIDFFEPAIVRNFQYALRGVSGYNIKLVTVLQNPNSALMLYVPQWFRSRVTTLSHLSLASDSIRSWDDAFGFDTHQPRRAIFLSACHHVNLQLSAKRPFCAGTVYDDFPVREYPLPGIGGIGAYVHTRAARTHDDFQLATFSRWNRLRPHDMVRLQLLA